jgi:hypothetical protein
MWTIKMLGVSQTLMHIHGSGEFNRGPHPDDPQLIDLDALGPDQESAREHCVSAGTCGFDRARFRRVSRGGKSKNAEPVAARSSGPRIYLNIA